MRQVSPSTSIDLQVRYVGNIPGTLARILTAIGGEGAVVREIRTLDVAGGKTTREISIEAADEGHQQTVRAAVEALEGVEVARVSDRTFALHEGGKIRIANRIPLRDRDGLSRAYTPGVARVCKAVESDLAAAYRYTIKGNAVAIVSDGSAVLGLGNIGPYGAMPVMEGKAMLFKQFADIDAFPLCLATQDVDEIVATVKAVSPTFGGINLEDISAPRCFVVEERLRADLDIPVFHDDQHGTAVVVTAGLYNALKVTGREMRNIRVAISGAGAAGVAIAKLLLTLGVGDLTVCDSKGAIYAGRTQGMNDYKHWLAANSNREGLQGSLADALRGADVFIGVSGPNVIEAEVLRTMAPEPIVFALANPVPEVDAAAASHIAAVLATGRSDFPNQVNNAVAFPGIFRGLLDARASGVNDAMLIAASKAVAAAVPDDALSADFIIPSVFVDGLSAHVGTAVFEAAVETGAARQLVLAGAGE